MRVQVIANCQARPISSLIQPSCPDAEVSEPIILHLAREEDADRHLEQIAGADIVLAQLTTETFRPAHLATPRLKELFGDRVVVWPNIFYSGQQPYLRYFTHPRLGRLLGPMEALHDIRLHRSWQETGQADPAALQRSDPEFVRNVRARSLQALQAREAQCDVVISDFITENEGTAKLFFTFNHPTRLVLSEMLRRLFSHLGINSAPLPPEGAEPLSRYQVPSVWSGSDPAFQGDGFSLCENGLAQRQPGPPVRYTAKELCRDYTVVYDAHEIFRTMESVRQTPEFPSPASTDYVGNSTIIPHGS